MTQNQIHQGAYHKTMAQRKNDININNKDQNFNKCMERQVCVIDHQSTSYEKKKKC